MMRANSWQQKARILEASSTIGLSNSTTVCHQKKHLKRVCCQRELCQLECLRSFRSRPAATAKVGFATVGCALSLQIRARFHILAFHALASSVVHRRDCARDG